jgi:hypothetical protein
MASCRSLTDVLWMHAQQAPAYVLSYHEAFAPSKQQRNPIGSGDALCLPETICRGVWGVGGGVGMQIMFWVCMLRAGSVSFG